MVQVCSFIYEMKTNYKQYSVVEIEESQLTALYRTLRQNPAPG